MKKVLFGAIGVLFSAAPVWAIVDTNSNGLSDIWEKYYNGGSLFSASNPNHSPTADPDSDGWNNSKEAVAGTNPFNSALPSGWVRSEIVQHPDTEGVFILKWPSIFGKNYKLEATADLIEWADFGEVIPGTGSLIELGVDAKNEDDTVPDKLFWRVIIDDDDADGDTLTSWEELSLGSDPAMADTDLDGIPDNVDPLPLSNAAVADPDGINLPASLATNLRGFWDFESQSGTGFPAIFPNRSGAVRNATSYTGGPQPLGMPSSAVRIGPGYVTIPPATVQGIATYTVSGWLKLEKDSIRNSSGLYQTVFALYDVEPSGPPPQNAPVGLGTTLLIRKLGTTEEWFVGGYQQNAYYNEPPNINGNPKTIYNGHTFVRPLGEIDDGEWHQFVVTRSNTSFGQKVYIDGALAFQGALRDYTVSYDSNTTFTFGKLHPASTAMNLNGGYLDRLRIHSKLLSAAEVTALYRQDVDSDGLWDITENSMAIWRDTNGDGIKQTTEMLYEFASPFLADPRGYDHDGDGIPSVAPLDGSGNPIGTDEQTLGTKPAKADSDGDLMPDGWEKSKGLNPLDPLDGTHDPDADGASNLEEYRNNTDPHKKDTDGDGKNDGQEINGPDGNPDTDDGSDPTDGTDGGNRRPANQLVSFKLGVGDRSGSQSEDYVLNVFRLDPISGAESRVFTLRSGGFGQYKEITKAFRKGDSYSFQLHWQGSNNNTRTAGAGVTAEGPDYDYHMIVEPQGSNPGTAILDSFDPRTNTRNPSVKLLDPEDVNAADDDDDDITDLPRTLGPLRVVFLSYDIMEVYSDQIAGNLANKLPTPFYRGESNNPMLMACRTSNRGYLDVRVKIPPTLASSVLVGARIVDAGGSWLPLSYPAVSAPNPTRIQFNVSYNGTVNFYEVVAGFDANANGVLEVSEIDVIFAKTPKTDEAGNPVAVDASIYDKIKVVTETEWVDSRLECLINNVWGTDYTGDLISAFAHGQSTVDEGITTSPVTVTSTQPGISHPVGARWNSSNSASTHKILFADGTEASNDVEASNAIEQIIEGKIAANLAAIKAATPNNGQWSNGGTYAFNESKRLIDTESEWVGINELGYAFGKVTFIGTMTVSSRWTSGGKLEVGSVTFSGGFTDLYDFSYWGGNRASFASKVQAGHATLTNSSEPDAGKIFFTEVQFNGLRDINKEY